MKFILYGGEDDATNRAREILENRKIPYRLELDQNYDGRVRVIGPIGMVSLRDLDLMLGNHSLEAETKTALHNK